MLLNQENRQTAEQVSVVTRSPEVTRLLSAIIESWKIPVTDNLASARMILAEWGLNGVGPEEKIVWLTPLPLETKPHLEVPLQLSALSQLLEKQFFSISRRQMRVVMEQPVEIIVEGRRLAARLISLSGRGARLSCPHEIIKTQKLEIDMTLGGRSLHLPGEVLYTLPAGDVPGHELPQVGVLLKPLDLQHCEALSRFVERTCLEQACSKTGIPINAPCVSWLSVPRNPWSVLPD